jgi:hypothetical protein
VSDSSGLNPQLTSDSSEAVIHAGAVVPRRAATRVPAHREDHLRSADRGRRLWALARLTQDAATDLDPRGRQTKWIYFSSNRGGGINVWRAPLDGDGHAAGSAQQLTTGAGDDVEPAPSPDGHRLALPCGDST